MIQPAFVMPGMMPAVPAPPPAPATPEAIPMDILAGKFRALRDKRDEIKARHTAELAPIKQAMDELGNVMLDALNRAGSNSMKTHGGTVYTSTLSSYSIDDPAVFRAWVESEGKPDFYANRVSKEALEAYLAEGNRMPPGLKVSSVVNVNVRK